MPTPPSMPVNSPLGQPGSAGGGSSVGSMMPSGMGSGPGSGGPPSASSSSTPPHQPPLQQQPPLTMPHCPPAVRQNSPSPARSRSPTPHRATPPPGHPGSQTPQPHTPGLASLQQPLSQGPGSVSDKPPQMRQQQSMGGGPGSVGSATQQCTLSTPNAGHGPQLPRTPVSLFAVEGGEVCFKGRFNLEVSPHVIRRKFLSWIRSFEEIGTQKKRENFLKFNIKEIIHKSI